MDDAQPCEICERPTPAHEMGTDGICLTCWKDHDEMVAESEREDADQWLRRQLEGLR
jgi:hypothetical protein